MLSIETSIDHRLKWLPKETAIVKQTLIDNNPGREH